MEHPSLMSEEYETDCNIAQILPSTWQAFFQKFGRLRSVQREAIPKVLQGEDVLIVSGTASGKTEAVCAPLLERNLGRKGPWTILYIAPTRALVNDLYQRLYKPAQRLNLILKRRTADHRDQLKRIPHILITTPESFDSMLCREKRDDDYGHSLAHVVAVVLDEVHLLYGTPRGEQIRWLIERLKKLRTFAASKKWIKVSGLQILGLSATVPDPEGVNHYFFSGNASIVKGESGRSIETVTVVSEDNEPISKLKTYLKEREKTEKILVFSNSRKRVDSLAEELKAALEPLGYDVYAHHGSLDKKIRENAENAAKKKDKIVVCATSTLEIGIDIGDIDLVCLDGPALDVSSFLQRIGRGNRRSGDTRVMPLYESIQDFIIHSAQIEAARSGWLGGGAIGPEYTVIRQQIASYLFQSQNKKRPLKKLKELFNSGLIDEDIFDSILNQMIREGELKEEGNSGTTIKLGQYWLDEADEMGKIHTNINSQFGMTVVDKATGQPIARGIIHKEGTGISIGGKGFEICKWNDRTLEVKNAVGKIKPSGSWQYVPSSGYINSNQATTVKHYLEVDEKLWPIIRRNGFVYVFHLGGARTHAILELIINDYMPGSKAVKVNDWYICFNAMDFSGKPAAFTGFNLPLLKLSLQDSERILGKIERIMNRPAASKKLPFKARILEIWEWLNPEIVAKYVSNSRWEPFDDKEKEMLLEHFI
jgi:ATP-dependent Lhr-like helicase